LGPFSVNPHHFWSRHKLSQGPSDNITPDSCFSRGEQRKRLREEKREQITDSLVLSNPSSKDEIQLFVKEMADGNEEMKRANNIEEKKLNKSYMQLS
jgi:hypothetical protein